MSHPASESATPRASPRRDESSILHGSATSCKVRAWPFQPEVAQLVLFDQTRLPTASDVARWLDQLRASGFNTVRTGAMRTPAGLRVESAGFAVIQELVLLQHDDPAAAAAAPPTRRLPPTRFTAASAVDVAAFGERWGLDPSAVVDVCRATPRHRARLTSDGTSLAGYAISGRDGKQGFFQRLAVDPGRQRQGHGRALLLDSLEWLARWRVSRVLVNTHVDNEAALALYDGTGFRRLPELLRVYEKALA